MSAKLSNNLEKLLGALSNSQVKDQNLVSESEQSFLDYSLSVITSRALPDLRDGLKPVHRRILYAAYEEKMFSDARFRKSATLVGAVMGGYHPHGDSSIYGALVRLAQDFSMRYPLLEGQGNFGSIDGDSPAAMRYTEVKMSKLGEKFLEGIKENPVDFAPNYDGSKEEPVILPIVAPSILLNGGDGVAVGMASKIPSHNLQELCNLAIALLDDPELPQEKMFEIIQGPDFPTGGLILGYEGVQKYLKGGRGSFRIRARAQLDEEKNQIIFTEIPYGVKKNRLIKKIAQLASEERNPTYKVVPLLQRFIKNIRDESNLKEGIRLVIECRQDAPLKTILNNLYKYTQLQQPYSVNLTVLSAGTSGIREPKTLGIIPVLREYLEYQLEILIRRTQFNLEKLRARIHLLEGRKIIVTDLKQAIDIITQEDEPEKLIKDKYSLSDIQVKDIFELPLRQLKRIEFQKLVDELAEKIQLRAEHEDRLESRDLQNQEIKRQLIEIMEEYSNDQRRSLIDIRGSYKLQPLDLIPQENLVISVSHKNYISALPLKEIRRSSNRGTKGVDVGKYPARDYVTDLLIASSHDDLLLFTNTGRVFKVKGYDIKISNSNKWTNKPLTIKNLLGYDGSLFDKDKDERVIKLISITPEDYKKEDLFLLFATKEGIVKKTRLSSEWRPKKNGGEREHNNFKTVNRRGKKAIALEKGDVLVGVVKTTDKDDVLLTSSSGRLVRFSASDLLSRGRDARGVKGINLYKIVREGGKPVKDENGKKVTERDGYLISVSSSYEGDKLLTVGEKGKGKINDLEAYRHTKRGARGVLAYKIFQDKRDPVTNKVIKDPKTGKTIKEKVNLVACLAVNGDEEISLLTESNHLNRFKVSKIFDAKGEVTKGKATIGVKLIDLDDQKKDDKVIFFTKYPSLEEQLGVSNNEEEQEVSEEE